LESFDTTPIGISVSTIFNPGARFRRMNPIYHPIGCAGQQVGIHRVNGDVASFRLSRTLDGGLAQLIQVVVIEVT
jgi:hypothetical protein